VYLITWLVVGLLAGLIAAAFVVRLGRGLLVDIAVGMLGAVAAGWFFWTMHLPTPFVGGPGEVLVAFGGAAVLLFLLRALLPRRRLA
jgi:uncharacterized membrane protein YeaQ/YmgE (transglycosylase-associated protein family)